MESHAAAKQFQIEGGIAEVRPYGSGNINDTFLVSTQEVSARYILQRLSPAVFPNPQTVMANLCQVSGHMRRRLQRDAGCCEKWRMAELIPCRNGAEYFVDANQNCWRMQRFIDKTRVCETVTTTKQARQIGKGLGCFHRLLSDLDHTRLHDTLPGFHITPHYLAQYDAVCDNHRLADQTCREIIENNRASLSVLEDAKDDGRLPVRVIHGDPKAGNFLFDENSDQVVSLIDLDTVKPGLIQYDLGDCLRSCCNPTGEETANLDEVAFDLERCRSIMEGYVGEAAPFLTDNDFHFMYDAVRLITFELGLRFYTDYLVGNIYFKAHDPEQNLRRARVQFRLLLGIEAQEKEIRAMAGGLR